MRKWAIQTLLLVSFVFLFSGMTLGADPVKIGVVYPLTGPIAAAGSYQKAGVEIARDKINSEGGILGRPFTLYIEYGANDPAQSVSAAEKLVTREKVDAMIAAW